MWLEPNEFSYWAYRQCLELKQQNLKDKDELWKLITHEESACLYCKFIKDRPQVRKYIVSSIHAHWYCMNVEERPEIRKLIKRKELNCYVV